MTNFQLNEFVSNFLYFLFIVSMIFFVLYGVFSWMMEVTRSQEKLLRSFSKPSKRFGTDQDLLFNIDASRNNLKAKIMNISQTGMFVNSYDSLPEPGDLIEFKIISRESGLPVTGRGLVRWVREKDDFGISPEMPDIDEDPFPIPKKFFPAGFGVEFQFITEESQGTLQTLFHEIKTSL